MHWLKKPPPNISTADSKETFRIISSLVNYIAGDPLPPATSDQTLANDFVQFFYTKIQKIRHGLDASDLHDNTSSPDLDIPVPHLSFFKVQTQKELEKVIRGCASKTCSLDAIPTALLKNSSILSVVLPTITELVNTSLSTGVFPNNLKRALVTPRLKKPGLDISVLGNYRPVSNIPFLSKVIERVVAQQLNIHLTRNGLHDDLQSAYKTGTSTETAILRIKTDIETVLDDGDAVLLVLLDLSAAFDTIDHNLLIERLRVEAGLTETTLRWVQSYLSDRIQAVKINNSVSSDVPLSTGVPQGSVLGPLLFLVYLLPLRRVINQYAINRHGFADDTQLYSRLSVKNTTMRTHQVNIMEECIASVRTWMTVNKLKLNDGKTEIMVVASPHNQCRLTDIRLKIGEAILTPRSTVKNLGAALDSTLSMEAQVSSCTSTSGESPR